MVGEWELPQGSVPAASYSVAGGAHAGGESNHPVFLLVSAQGVGRGEGESNPQPCGAFVLSSGPMICAYVEYAALSREN